ncbi:uncharacterized protein LOC130697965 [Daphnia carinata]|uniref:uncharacterized protein LOC130697965 n=1 Tax=Daphnia carinata TaxID=120202 RepID=UPI00257C4068|nr:uncharacterized protein LOC130697965 [Daphnia carinata]
MKFSLLSLFLVATVVCVSVIDSAPAPHWPRFRERRLRNRPAETKVEEGKKEEKVEAAPEEKKEEKAPEAEPSIDFGTLAVEEAAPEAKKEEVAVVAPAPKKAAKVEEAEEEEAEGLSAEV